jgi:ParB-like chromosome segregation protein Spo0J
VTTKTPNRSDGKSTIAYSAETDQPLGFGPAMSEQQNPVNERNDPTSTTEVGLTETNSDKEQSPEVVSKSLIVNLPITDITIDPELQSRAAMSDSAIQDYCEALKRGVALPPVQVVKDVGGSRIRLVDGFHRLAAYQKLERNVIPAQITVGDQATAIELAVTANATHGLQRTNADKQKAIKLFLSQPGKASLADRAVADKLNVSNKTVARVRAELEANSTIAQVTARTTKSGRIQRVPTQTTQTATESTEEFPSQGNRGLENKDVEELNNLPHAQSDRTVEHVAEAASVLEQNPTEEIPSQNSNEESAIGVTVEEVPGVTAPDSNVPVGAIALLREIVKTAIGLQFTWKDQAFCVRIYSRDGVYKSSKARGLHSGYEMTQTSFQHSLKKDLAVTVSQALRHHAVGSDDMKQMELIGAVELVTMSVSESKRADIRHQVTFVCQPGELKLIERPNWRLRHLAALAEIRHVLQAIPENWDLRTLENPRDHNGNFLSMEIPDAIWRSPIGKVAIEFDAGGHAATELRKKIQAYSSSREWQHQWWFAPTAVRAMNILGLFEESSLSPLVWRVGVIDWL